MTISQKQQTGLRKLPNIDTILDHAGKDLEFKDIPKSIVLAAARRAVESIRNAIIDNTGFDAAEDKNLEDFTEEQILEIAIEKTRTFASDLYSFNLKKVINATGVVVHTNLGRSLLEKKVLENIVEVTRGYSNLEFDLTSGTRGSRYSNIEKIICELTGAEAAMVVNNNAAAVLVCLDTAARGKKVIVSRGELVEIGGSFRIPDVMTKSGCTLTETGTTNRTHPNDYESAIESETALLLKVHTSNYSVVGFTSSVSLKELVSIGAKYHIPVMEDLGSGTLIDFSKYGLPREPTIKESVSTGADIVTFSGDKLLGGPQAGIIVGKKDMIDKIKANPLTRALRIDKMTLAGLEATLSLYRDEAKAISEIPTLRMLLAPFDELEQKAQTLKTLLEKIGNGLKVTLKTLPSKAGGGSMPLLDLPSRCICVTIDNTTPNSIEILLRNNTPPIIGRIEEDMFIIDPRTIDSEDLPVLQVAFAKIVEKDNQ